MPASAHRYAIADPKDGERPAYRLVTDPAEALPGETVLDAEPAPGEVWDAVSGALRPRTDAEELEEAKAEKVREIRDRAEAETAGVMRLYEVLYLVRNRISDPRLAEVDAIAKKGRDLEALVTQAATPAEVGAVSWT